MDTEKFIECVKGRPMLYNTQHKQYKNHSQKVTLWEEIAKEMGESSEVLRTKWKGLKDGYTKYKRWQTHPSSSVKAYSQWCWGQHLKFLEPYIYSRKRKHGSSIRSYRDSSLSNEDSLRKDSEEFLQETENALETIEVLEDECHIKEEPVPSTSAASVSTSRSESRMSFRDPITIEGVDDNTNLLNFVQNKRSKGIDAVDLLFMSYADTFRKFSMVTQTKLKVKMANIFADAELHEYNMSHNAPS